MKISSRWILLLVAACCLSACGKAQTPAWLRGKWQFDADATRKELQAKTSSADPAKTTAPLANMTYALALFALPTMEMDIGPDTIIISFNGTRKISDVSVFEQDAEKCTLRKADGTLTDYHKMEKGFWTLSDDGGMKLFFKRKGSQD